MCGIVGILSDKPVATELYESLIQLQHRGQDAAGMITLDKRFYAKIGQGMVKDLFCPADLKVLAGNMGVAHVRYPTTGSLSTDESQPFWLGSPYGIALAHNGNLTNYAELLYELKNRHRRHLNTRSDSEALIHLLANSFETQNIPSCDMEFFNQVCTAITDLFDKVKGSYSVITAVLGKGLIAFRDPYGIRPLSMGTRMGETQQEVIFASEPTPFLSLGFKSIGSVLPGEVVYVNPQGQIFRKRLKHAPFRPCAFEYVYFARPDSHLDGISVYKARFRMGEHLAKLWQKNFAHLKPDVIIPVPFTSNTAALGFATALGVPYSEGLYKNPFIGRTFIMPNHDLRKRSVRHKLSPQTTEIAGKNVLLLDDSIVRGTTSLEIIQMVKEAGAREVYFASSCPPIRYPCYYGINIPTHTELLAHKKTLPEIKAYLGVDALLYLSQEGLEEAILQHGESMQKPCMACMDGQYMAGVINTMEEIYAI